MLDQGVREMLKRPQRIASRIAELEPRLVVALSEKAALVLPPIKDVVVGLLVHGAPRWVEYRLDLFAFPIAQGFERIVLNGQRVLGSINPSDPDCASIAVDRLRRKGIEWLMMRSSLEGLLETTPPPQRGLNEFGGLRYTRGAGVALRNYCTLLVLTERLSEARVLIEAVAEQHKELGDRDLICRDDYEQLVLNLGVLLGASAATRREYFMRQRERTIAALGIDRQLLANEALDVRGS